MNNDISINAYYIFKKWHWEIVIDGAPIECSELIKEEGFKNAKRRGKEFTLTFEEFSAFCSQTNYILGKGRTAESFTIDRIDNDKGYTIDNIKILTLSENASKHTKRLEYNWQDHSAKMIPNSPPLNGPF